MVFIAFICLFLNVNSFLYLSIELSRVDDCISRIYTDNNDTIFEYYNITLPCLFNIEDYPNPLVLLFPYEFGQKIFFDFYDYGGGEGYFIATVYLNEYIIKPEHQNFGNVLIVEEITIIIDIIHFIKDLIFMTMI